MRVTCHNTSRFTSLLQLQPQKLAAEQKPKSAQRELDVIVFEDVIPPCISILDPATTP